MEDYNNKNDEKKTQRFKDWRAEVSSAATDKINDLKEQLREKLLRDGHEVVDFGTNSAESCDYPVFAAVVGALLAGSANLAAIRDAFPLACTPR